MADQNTSTVDADAPASRQDTASPTRSEAPQTAPTFAPLPEEGDDLEADSDSACGESVQSGSTSLRSSIINGIMENGRRYQSLRDGGTSIPSDGKQFDSMEAGHMAFTILESQQDNPYFRSKLSPNAQHILDLGTGQASWPIAVADRFPNITVHGVDLYPPPRKWVPPNCILEVDDVSKPFTWHHKFDLVHIRLLSGSFTVDEWQSLYERIYQNLAPGGWIEHVDVDSHICCDDKTLPADSILGKFGDEMKACLDQTGNTIEITELMRGMIENAGFTNIHERHYKFPIGEWPKHPVYKEAGVVNLKQFKDGLEGWVMHTLTRFGLPTPWTPEEVTVYVAKLRKELSQNYHIYNWNRRVWAQKPFDAPKGVEQPVGETVEPVAA